MGRRRVHKALGRALRAGVVRMAGGGRSVMLFICFICFVVDGLCGSMFVCLYIFFCLFFFVAVG